jgi:acetyl esterase/lipase
LHLEALVPDFATGIAGLSQEIAANGRDAIPESAQRLFVDAFDYTRGLPPVFLLHGKNDTGVPFILSESAAEKLKKAGTQVTTEFPVDAQHGFDVALGRIDIESVSSGDSNSPAVDSLKRAIEFLDKEVSRQ